MKLIAVLHTTDYRGDHAADVEILYEVAPGETVDALAARLMGKTTYIRCGAESIVIKLVEPAPAPPPTEERT